MHCGSDCRQIPQTPNIPLADFIKAIDTITPHVEPKKTMIVLTGGEPLMRNDLEQCGQALYDRGFPWGMVTNGLLLSKKRFTGLEQAGLRSISVSLDGFEESHNRMRGRSESFKGALNAINIIVQSNLDVAFDVVTCVIQWNFSELPVLKEMLIKMGVKAWRLFAVFPIGRAAGNKNLQLDTAQFKGLFEFIHETRREGRIKTDYGCEGFLGNYETEVRDNFFFCRAGTTI